jgi:hypothetical protein
MVSSDYKYNKFRRDKGKMTKFRPISHNVREFLPLFRFGVYAYRTSKIPLPED